MRDYGRVYTRFWSSEDVRALSDDGRLLALYLLSSEHTTLTGAFRLPDGYATEDLQWTSERVRKGLDELYRNGFANRCETTKWVWVRKFLDWNEPENPNQWKAARKIASQIPPTCKWLFEFQQDFARRTNDPPPQKSTPQEPSVKGSETLSKPGSGTGVGTGTETGSQNARASEPTVPRGTDPKPTRVELDDVPSQLLAAIKAVHPRGTYREALWMPAEREIRSCLEEGYTAEEIFEGDKRYALQTEARGNVGTQYVIGPDRFFRERMFREPFPLPAPGEKRGHGPTRDEQEHEDMCKLRERRAALGIADFRDPNPGETAEQYRQAQNMAWNAKQPRDVAGVARQLAQAKAVA